MLYLAEIAGRTWCLRALLNFSDDSLAMYALCAACMAFKFSATTSHAVTLSSTGGLFKATDGKFRFLPKTNSLGLNPCTVLRVFLALTAQATATSNEHLVSSRVLMTHSSITPLYLLQTLLLHRLSAPVVLTIMLRFWHISWKYWLSNSRPLSVRTLLGHPKYATQYLKIVLIIVELSLFGTLTATLYFENRSIRCKILFPFISFISRATHSLNLDGSENPTTGLGCTFLYLKHVSHDEGISSNILRNSWSVTPIFLAKSFNFLPVGWLNCLCNLVAIFSFSAEFLFTKLGKNMCIGSPSNDTAFVIGT